MFLEQMALVRLQHLQGASAVPQIWPWSATALLSLDPILLKDT